MVILQAKKNSLIGSSLFAVKRPILKDSTYILTSEVSKYGTWGIKDINERQKKLAELAVKTWPITI